MLHNDRHIRFDQARIRRIERNFFRVFKMIKAQMFRAPGGHREFVWAGGIPIFKKDGNYILDKPK